MFYFAVLDTRGIYRSKEDLSIIQRELSAATAAMNLQFKDSDGTDTVDKLKQKYLERRKQV